jgi:ABC-type transport system involved in cytochrome bd biosynthesis fused ATPase/permease subunit
VSGEADWYQREEDERNERRGLEQRAATLIAALLFTIGLVATGARDLAGSGQAARILLTVAMVVLALAVLLLAAALTRRTSDNNRIWDLPKKRRKVSFHPSEGRVAKIIEGNITILLTARLATSLLALGVVIVMAALIVSFYDPGPGLGSPGRPVEVHTAP